MPPKEIKTAKNTAKLLGMCWDKNMSQEQIHILTKSVREARTAKEKELEALKLIMNLNKTEKPGKE